MSRSYKKTPRSGEKKNRYLKKYANRIYRRDKFNVLPYSSYKKNFCSYDICDYETVGYTFEDWWRDTLKSWYNWGYKYEPFPNKESEYRTWYKWYKAK